MQELTIRSESVQRMYSFYREKRLIVNRRYQRKLVWGIDEKAAFIASIIKEFPVPLCLFAEGKRDDETIFEIIDGTGVFIAYENANLQISRFWPW